MIQLTTHELVCDINVGLSMKMILIMTMNLIYSVVDPSQRENLGIIVQYKVKVKLCLGALGG